MQEYGSRHLEVFVVDDHDIVRRGLLDLLTKRDITVIGDSGSALHATSRILELRPDVMMLDVHLQDGSGVQVCRDVRAADPSIKGVLLTASGDDEALVLAILSGASGYVVKVASTADVVDTVRRVGAGRTVLGAAVTDGAKSDLMARAARLQPRLTSRQMDVVERVLAGDTDQQIAEALQEPLQATRADVAQLIARLT
jgi:two-component system, NarL family, response regulator DevR